MRLLIVLDNLIQAAHFRNHMIILALLLIYSLLLSFMGNPFLF
ncbi:hypothetical protein BMETH_486_1 [methanotrophic bacterial endosymbiont of Bathymodiolus sp.]|jgi:hypothetical protein|nr:hypothetical protein BMETH_486_1 [methanotrophic bacterial endosymbiont of Bathymodiolus sp.]